MNTVSLILEFASAILFTAIAMRTPTLQKLWTVVAVVTWIAFMVHVYIALGDSEPNPSHSIHTIGR